jgi:hypothetical protein
VVERNKRTFGKKTAPWRFATGREASRDKSVSSWRALVTKVRRLDEKALMYTPTVKGFATAGGRSWARVLAQFLFPQVAAPRLHGGNQSRASDHIG